MFVVDFKEPPRKMALVVEFHVQSEGSPARLVSNGT
jgi:hypothetical protein